MEQEITKQISITFYKDDVKSLARSAIEKDDSGILDSILEILRDSKEFKKDVEDHYDGGML